MYCIAASPLDTVLTSRPGWHGNTTCKDNYQMPATEVLQPQQGRNSCGCRRSVAFLPRKYLWFQREASESQDSTVLEGDPSQAAQQVTIFLFQPYESTASSLFGLLAAAGAAAAAAMIAPCPDPPARLLCPALPHLPAACLIPSRLISPHLRGPGPADADGHRDQGRGGARAHVPGELVARPRGDMPHGGGNPAPTLAAEPARVPPSQGGLFLRGNDRASSQGKEKAPVFIAPILRDLGWL